MPLSGAIAEHFLSQAAASRRLGSPFTGHLCGRLADLLDRDTALGRRVADWPGPPREDALALRVCGGLHALTRSGRAPALADVYPPAPVPAPGFDAALTAAIREHDAELAAFLGSPPQTNEVARSAILLGGLLSIADETALPLDLFEIGASAGLNLIPDRYAFALGDGREWGDTASPVRLACGWRGRVPPLDAPLTIGRRRGSDAAPIDAADPEGRMRLLAYVWPDQPDRLARIEAALGIAAREGSRIERADAADWAGEVLSAPAEPGRARVLMHSVMWQYLAAPTRARIAAAVSKAGALATIDTPLAWLRLEADETPGSAAILLDLWPGNSRGGGHRLLGRGDFHGRWADWI